MVGEIVMKQFNLDEYLKNPNRKVVTRDSRNVRIVCTDRMDDDYPVVALVRGEVSEELLSYTEDGALWKNQDDDSDLFFAPEKKEGWINLYNSYEGTVGRRVYRSEKEAKSEIDQDKLYISTVKVEWEE